jgi:ribosomal 50S subunit-associated protein YjgA (DUF615 family)
VGVFLQTCYLTHRNTVKFVKRGLGGKDVEAILQRLDRLTQEYEARTTAAQSLEAVYDLIQNMSVVLEILHETASDVNKSKC